MNARTALTATDIAAGARALANLIDEHGLPEDTHPHQALETTLVVNTVEEVHAFAAQHGLPVREHGRHTRTELALGTNPNAHAGALAAFRGSLVLRVTHIADPEPEAPAADVEAVEIDPTSPNWAPALAMHQALEGAEITPAAKSPHRAVYECATHGVTILCGADSTDEDYEQWLEDVQDHEEQHLAEPVPYELADAPAPAELPDLPQRVRGSHGGFQPDDRVRTSDGPGAVRWAKPVGTFTVVAVELDDMPGHVVGYLAHQLTLDLDLEGAQALAEVEAPDADDDGTAAASTAEVQAPRTPAGTSPLPTWYAYADGVIAQVGDVVTIGKGRGHWKITELYPAPANYGRDQVPAAYLISDTGKRPQRNQSNLANLHLVARAGVAAREAAR